MTYPVSISLSKSTNLQFANYENSRPRNRLHPLDLAQGKVGLDALKDVAGRGLQAVAKPVMSVI